MTIKILDSTLRDGAQGENISFTIADKISIIKKLDELGVSYIEAGNPSSNPKDIEVFKQLSKLNLKNSKLVAFTSTRKPNQQIMCSDSVNLTLDAKTDVVSIFGKSNSLQVTQVLQTSLQENLEMIYDTVKYFAQNNKEIIFDAEHFFDGYIYDREYAMQTLNVAKEAGASCIVLCDTNGGTFPQDICKITKSVVDSINCQIGIHCHNDMGCAVANTLMAVEAGATHIQGTYIGFGERCGNANLSTIIPSLQLKRGYECIPKQKMNNITKVARYIADISNVTLDNNMPYVGKSAFAHKGGMHVDAVIKDSNSFEHISPEIVGNKSNILISEVSGRSSILSIINEIDSSFTKSSIEVQELLDMLKKLEYKGYLFESATASLELIIRRRLRKMTSFFDFVEHKLISEHVVSTNAKSSLASVIIEVDGELNQANSYGDGPVHAIDSALRQAVKKFYPSVEDMRLVDYKVRVIEPKAATAAMVRVLIESTDGDSTWTTVGVSRDIIRASFYALKDSVEYKLIKDKINRSVIHE